MEVERRNKVENPVAFGRSSMVTNGDQRLIPDDRVRQPHVAKEPLCGNQPANLSLVIAVLRFASPFCRSVWLGVEVIESRIILNFFLKIYLTRRAIISVTSTICYTAPGISALYFTFSNKA